MHLWSQHCGGRDGDVGGGGSEANQSANLFYLQASGQLEPYFIKKKNVG